MDTPTDSLRTIDRDACFRLLGQQAIGRLGVVDGHRPMIFPVNFCLVGEEVVFRTDAGAKLHSAERAPVCFEVDDFDTVDHTGWSVVIAGHAEPLEAEAVESLPLRPWAGGEKAHWFRIRTDWVSGRRIGAVPT